MLREITFIIGTDKPNGDTVQDDLFKKWKPAFAVFATVILQKASVGVAGWTHNSSTGTLDFTSLGGVSNGVLNLYCTKCG